MKNLLITSICIGIACVFSGARDGQYISSRNGEFEVRVIELDGLLNLSKTIYYKGDFISLSSNRVLVISDSLNSFDLKKTDKLNKLHFKDIFIHDDKFYAINQDNDVFYLTQNYEWIEQMNNQPEPTFYEDERFKVQKTCSGEWGGTIFFIDKKTNKKYGSEATCPIVINKLKERYYVTATLAHGGGSASVLLIQDPRLLDEVKPKKESRKKIKYVGEDELTTANGARELQNSYNTLNLTSFTYKGEFYNIYNTRDLSRTPVFSRRNFTILSKLLNDKFIIVDTLTNESLWTPRPITSRTGDYTVSTFDTSETEGFIAINEGVIEIFRSKK